MAKETQLSISSLSSFGEMAASIWGRGESFFDRPTATETADESLLIDTQFVGPSGQTLRLAVENNQHIPSRVSALLYRSCPSAIIRRIIAIIVREAIDAVLGAWLFAQVGKKCRKRESPTIADSDSPCPVVSILGI